MKNSEPIYYLNGKFVPKSKAKISVNDLGLLRGYGVFDYIITYKGGRSFLLRKHLKRLYNSAKLIGLRIPYKSTYVKNLIVKTINKNKNGKEKAVRIIVTGGESENAISLAEKPTIIILVNDRKVYPPFYYENGAKVITFEFNRESPQAKSLNYIQGVKANILAKKKGAVEAIYVHKHKVYEGTTSNLFLIKNNKVITPDSDTLPGITRELVMKLCKNSYPILMREVKINELFNADEIFLSASNKEVMPVVKVNSIAIGNGKPGEITLKIMAKFRRFVVNGRW